MSEVEKESAPKEDAKSIPSASEAAKSKSIPSASEAGNEEKGGTDAASEVTGSIGEGLGKPEEEEEDPNLVKYKQETYTMYELKNKYSFAEYQLSDFADAFKMYDIMGDNFLSSAQLYKALTWLGENPPDAEYAKVLDKVDVEGTDCLTFQNMLDILSHFSHAPITEMELHETFELLDQDRSGTVDAGELKRLMTCVGNALTQEEAEAMIAEADDDCSGEVDFDEFSHTILSTQY